MGCGAGKTQVVVIEDVKKTDRDGRTPSPAAAAKNNNGQKVPLLEHEEDRIHAGDLKEASRHMSHISSIEDPGGIGTAQAKISARMGTKSGPKIIQKIAEYNHGNEYSLIVLGAGPAGVKAAVEAAGRGVRVALIDVKASITGAPTGAHSKCLREAVLSGAKTWAGAKKVAMQAAKATLAATSRELRTFHIEVLHGKGAVSSDSSLEFVPAEPGQLPRMLTFETLVIATGSKSNRFPPVNFDLPGVFDSDTIGSIDRLPKNLIVQGAGIIGLEYALIFKKLGSETVVVIDCFDKVVPMLDTSLQQACIKVMQREGVELVMNTKFEHVEPLAGSTQEAPGVRISLQGGRVLEGDCLLSACGRSGCTGGIGLEVLKPLGLKVGRGQFVESDENGWTGVRQIYAVGDVAGGNLATVGQAQAMRAMRKCYGSGLVTTEKGLCCRPSGVWTIPELAWAGITEERAKSDGIPYGTVTVDFNRTVRGCVTNEEGFLKLIYKQETGELLGFHMCGENACDLINYGTQAICDGDTIYELLQFVFPAVTYHELYHLAAAEAKLRIMHHGAKNLEAATLWWQVEEAIRKSAESEGKTLQEILHQAFRYFDLNLSGFITPPQLKMALRGLGLELEDEQIFEMIHEATGSEDLNNVDYEHFLKVFHDTSKERQVS